MTYDMYRYIFIISTGLCILMAIVSILIFILMKIPSVIGDLSGSTAKKAIADIRRKNEAVSEANSQRIKRTEKIDIEEKNVFTQKIQGLNETTILSPNETTILSSNETTILNPNETTLLNPENITVLQNNKNQLTKTKSNVKKGSIQIIDEIIFVNSDEII